jgi:MFS family permease
LLGGFITTYLSWRIAFLLEDVIIVIVLSGIKLVNDVPYTGPRHIDVTGAVLSVLGMGGTVLAILVWEEGAEAVVALAVVGVIALVALARWLVRRKRSGKPALIDAGLFTQHLFRYGITGQLLQQIGLGGLMIVLPLYLQMVFEYSAMGAGLTIAPLSLSMFAVALLAGKRSGRRRPASIIRAGFALVALGVAVLIPVVPRATNGWYLVVPLIIAGSGLGLLVSQLNNYTLSPIDEEHVSEAAGVNSAGGSFGLSFGLAFAGAILLAFLSFSFTNQAHDSTVLSSGQKAEVSQTLEHDAEFMSNSKVQQQIAHESPAVQDEILSINTTAQHHSLQIALLIPLVSALLGLGASFRMMRLPDPVASEAADGLALG